MINELVRGLLYGRYNRVIGNVLESVGVPTSMQKYPGV